MRVLALPETTIDLVLLALRRAGLHADAADDVITCPLLYEDGTELLFVVWTCPGKVESTN
jgi:hypothetical protein